MSVVERIKTKPAYKWLAGLAFIMTFREEIQSLIPSFNFLNSAETSLSRPVNPQITSTALQTKAKISNTIESQDQNENSVPDRFDILLNKEALFTWLEQNNLIQGDFNILNYEMAEQNYIQFFNSYDSSCPIKSLLTFLDQKKIEFTKIKPLAAYVLSFAPKSEKDRILWMNKLVKALDLHFGLASKAKQYNSEMKATKNAMQYLSIVFAQRYLKNMSNEEFTRWLYSFHLSEDEAFVEEGKLEDFRNNYESKKQENRKEAKTRQEWYNLNGADRAQMNKDIESYGIQSRLNFISEQLKLNKNFSDLRYQEAVREKFVFVVYRGLLSRSVDERKALTYLEIEYKNLDTNISNEVFDFYIKKYPGLSKEELGLLLMITAMMSHENRFDLLVQTSSELAFNVFTTSTLNDTKLDYSTLRNPFNTEETAKLVLEITLNNISRLGENGWAVSFPILLSMFNAGAGATLRALSAADQHNDVENFIKYLPYQENKQYFNKVQEEAIISISDYLKKNPYLLVSHKL